MTKEALKLALEALDNLAAWTDGEVGGHMDEPYSAEVARRTITAIKEALAQPEQEPVGDFYITKDMAEHIKKLEVDWTICASGSKRPTEKKVVPVFVGNTTPPQPWEKFCDSNCVWTDHHPDCKLAEQEPVAWRNAAIRVGEDLCSVGPFGYYDMTAEQWLDWALSVVTVHAPPPQRKPLTDEEIADAVREADFDWHYGWTLDDEEPNRFTKFARAIEAAHGIKGEA